LPASHPRVKGVTVFCDRIALRVGPSSTFNRTRD
jgi:hypothetical protein